MFYDIRFAGDMNFNETKNRSAGHRTSVAQHSFLACDCLSVSDDSLLSFRDSQKMVTDEKRIFIFLTRNWLPSTVLTCSVQAKIYIYFGKRLPLTRRCGRNDLTLNFEYIWAVLRKVMSIPRSHEMRCDLMMIMTW